MDLRAKYECFLQDLAHVGPCLFPLHHVLHSFPFHSVLISMPQDRLIPLPSLLTPSSLHKFIFSPPHSLDNSHLYFRVHLKCQFHTAAFADPHPPHYSFRLGWDLWLHILTIANFSLFIALRAYS